MFHRLREAFRHFYPIYKLYAFHKISANILSPEDCELIMCNPIHNRKGQVYDLIRWWLKDGLLTSEGPKWQARRKILTPAFHFSILQQFVQIFNEEGEKLVEVLKHECAKSYVNVTPHITQFTLKTIVGTFQVVPILLFLHVFQKPLWVLNCNFKPKKRKITSKPCTTSGKFLSTESSTRGSFTQF